MHERRESVGLLYEGPAALPCEQPTLKKRIFCDTIMAYLALESEYAIKFLGEFLAFPVSGSAFEMRWHRKWKW